MCICPVVSEDQQSVGEQIDSYNQMDSYKPNVSYLENIVRISQFLCYSFPGGIMILVPPVVSEIGNSRCTCMEKQNQISKNCFEICQHFLITSRL